MNVIENVFPKVCTEMLEVIKYIPDSEFDKIESEFIETLYQEHDIFYDFKLDEELTTDDKILTLSTCTDDGTKRIVIHAKMIKAEYR